MQERTFFNVVFSEHAWAATGHAAFAGAIVANELIDETHDSLGSFGDVQVAFAAFCFF